MQARPSAGPQAATGEVAEGGQGRARGLEQQGSFHKPVLICSYTQEKVILKVKMMMSLKFLMYKLCLFTMLHHLHDDHSLTAGNCDYICAVAGVLRGAGRPGEGL